MASSGGSRLQHSSERTFQLNAQQPVVAEHVTPPAPLPARAASGAPAMLSTMILREMCRGPGRRTILGIALALALLVVFLAPPAMCTS